MDASFNALVERYQPLYAELLANFTREELMALAKSLPYDEQAAAVVVSGTMLLTQDLFRRWLDRPAKMIHSLRRRDSDVAAYVAAASQHAASKVLEEVAELKKQEKAKLEGLKALLESAGKSKKLQDAMKGKQDVV